MSHVELNLDCIVEDMKNSFQKHFESKFDIINKKLKLFDQTNLIAQQLYEIPVVKELYQANVKLKELYNKTLEENERLKSELDYFINKNNSQNINLNIVDNDNICSEDVEKFNIDIHNENKIITDDAAVYSREKFEQQLKNKDNKYTLLDSNGHEIIQEEEDEEEEEPSADEEEEEEEEPSADEEEEEEEEPSADEEEEPKEETQKDKEETIKLCENTDCERHPPDWDDEEDTEDTYQEGQWKKCNLCDGYFDDDGFGDILFVQEEPNNQEAECNLCGKSENIVQMKGSGQYLCEAACDEEEEEEEEEEEQEIEQSADEEEEEEIEQSADEEEEEEQEIEQSADEEEEEEEDEEVYEIKINRKKYFTNDDKNGNIYQNIKGNPGNLVGVFINGKPKIN